MTKYYILLVVMTLLGAVASLFLKKASSSKSIFDLIKNKNIYIGGFLYLSSAILNIYLLKFLNYSVVLPMTSITYIWTMILSYYILKEKISRKKIIGVISIILGVMCIAL